MLLIDVAFRLRAGIRRDSKSRAFVAYCPALDIYSAGQDLASAKAAIDSAVRLFLEACWSRGQFEAVLQRRDFRVDSDRTQLDDIREAEIAAIRQAKYDTIVDLDVSLSLIGRERPETCLH